MMQGGTKAALSQEGLSPPSGGPCQSLKARSGETTLPSWRRAARHVTGSINVALLAEGDPH